MKNNTLIPSTENQKAFDRILRFLSEGDITLSSQDELILTRWNFVHKMVLQRKYTEEQIVETVSDMHSVSKFTARRDIYQVHALFGSMINVNKKFALHHHAEHIKLLISRFENDKSLVHLVPKLMDSYTKAIAEMPEDNKGAKLPPPITNLFIVSGQNITQDVSIDDAIANMKTRQAQPKPQDDDDFIEFEENDK